MFVDVAVDAMVSIISHLIFIILAWKGLEALHFEKLIAKNKVVESRILYIMLSITIGTTVSNFFLDFINWSRQLTYLL
ncbi:hypothetical protein CEY16_07440 [Halalkalibacillus sediminis]|uniref:DUF1146 domain-containing protein n=1 Tax=Halalkalibacillus sediminis TaxID=2018042 RepID=A0A2I0QTV9_9BACI|nr:DUF1146 family protein [Halalkalibacillus sediminis]PKR77756.1 hypothetical protein CEY16_07440 [Halalkalibacillus sediminis]